MKAFLTRIMFGTIGRNRGIDPDIKPDYPLWTQWSRRHYVSVRGREFQLETTVLKTSPRYGGVVDRGIAINDPEGGTWYHFRYVRCHIPDCPIYINWRQIEPE